MAQITLHTGVTIDSSEVTSAEFWEQGASVGIHLVRRASSELGQQDQLTITIQDVRGDLIYGPEARRLANELENAGVHVNRHLKMKVAG
jgi:hypothetical protein